MLKFYTVYSFYEPIITFTNENDAARYRNDRIEQAARWEDYDSFDVCPPELQEDLTDEYTVHELFVFETYDEGVREYGH